VDRAGEPGGRDRAGLDEQLMGYQDVDLYKLHFEDRPGLEVTAEGLTTDDLFAVMELSGKLQDGTDLTDPAVKEALQVMMKMLAGALAGWNVEDRNGQPVPATLEGVRSQKLGLVMDIVLAWVQAQTDVDDGLGKDSGSGGNSGLERSLAAGSHSLSPPS
jgi:hypothetical protein